MKKTLISLVLVLALLGGAVAGRDALLFKILPMVASHFAVALKVEAVHLELFPLTLKAKALEARWRGGEAHFKGIEARFSLFIPSLRELVVDEGRVLIRPSPGGGESGFHLPATLRRVVVGQLTLRVEAPGGELEIGRCGLWVDTRRYVIHGGLSWEGRGVKLKGRFSFAGSRESLAMGGLRGGGRVEGTLWVGKRVVKGVLNLPQLMVNPRGPVVEIRGGYLELPGVLEAEGNLALEDKKGSMEVKGKVVSLGALGGFVSAFPRGVDGVLPFSGKVLWGSRIVYRVELEGGRLWGLNMGVLKKVFLAFSGVLEGDGDGGSLTLDRLVLEDLKLPWGEDGGWKGRGDVDWRKGVEGLAGHLDLSKGEMKITVEGSVPQRRWGDARVTLAFKNIDGAWLSRWANFKTSLWDKGSVEGRFQGEVKVRGGGGKWAVEGKVKGEGLSVSVPPGNGMEGVGASLAFRSRDLVRGPWHLSLDLGEGQALYSYWFFDFSRIPWHFSLDLSRSGRGLCVEEAEYRGLGQGKFQGRFCFPGGGKGKVVFQGKSEVLYSQLVSEPLGEDEPYLKKVSLGGGLKARIFVAWNGALAMKGTIGWKGRLEAPRVSLEGSMVVPLVYASKGREEGWFAMERLTLGPLVLKSWFTPLKGRPFSLKGSRGYEASLWKGSVRWGPFLLYYRDVRNPRFEVDGLSFEGLVPPHAPLPMVLEGKFDKVEGDRKDIFFHGVVRVKVADGEVKITKLRLLNPFTDLMKVGCDIEFQHLNLEELTRVTPFGKITGYIKGYIKDLVISHGQPESFRLRVETQDVKGVKKRISLEAINSISILGGGGPVSLFLPFFKSFGYSYLGLACTLKNDVFTLHGLKRKGKYEYIVEKGGLTGVDVINRNPHNRINFDDMMERLERIRRGKDEKN